MENSSNSTNFIITTTVTVLLAFLGYLITYFNNKRLTQRTDRLNRINRQLSEFYGPLFALSHASNIARQKFLEEHAPGRNKFFASGIKHSENELREWRNWMRTVFMPINTRIYELILSKSDLLIEAQMPTCLVVLCAHVASYKVVLEKWEKDDFSDHVAVVSFPKDFHDYTKISFDTLKCEQSLLLGKKTSL